MYQIYGGPLDGAFVSRGRQLEPCEEIPFTMPQNIHEYIAVPFISSVDRMWHMALYHHRIISRKTRKVVMVP